MSGDHNMYQKTKSYLDDFECPRCGHCCYIEVYDDDTSQKRVDETSKAQHEWVGLTDEEIAQGLKESWVTEQAWQSAVWWAEAKLKEKNT
jgi:hypothetical protein